MIRATGIDKPDFFVELLRVFLEEFPINLFTERGNCPVARIVTLTSDGLDYWEKLKMVLMAIAMGTLRDDDLNGHRLLVLHTFIAMISGIGMFKGQHVADFLGGPRFSGPNMGMMSISSNQGKGLRTITHLRR